MSLVRIQHAITGEVADVEQEAFDTVWSGKQWTIVPGATNPGDAFVTQWKPKTSYKAGEWVVNPSGELVSTIADFQSGVSYDATKFGPTAQSGTYVALTGAQDVAGIKNFTSTPTVNGVQIAAFAETAALKHRAQVLLGRQEAMARTRLLIGGKVTTLADGAATTMGATPVIQASIVSLAFTAVAATDLVTAVGHPLRDGDAFQQWGSAVGGMVNDGIYYVRDATADTFKVSATPFGAAIDLTSDGAGTARIVNPVLRFERARPAIAGSAFPNSGMVWSTGLDSTNGALGLTTCFHTDATAFEFQRKGDNTGGEGIKVFVDGSIVPVTDGGANREQVHPGPGSGTFFRHVVTLPSTLGTRQRCIRVEGGNVIVADITVANGKTITRCTCNPGPRVIVLGDSFTEPTYGGEPASSPYYGQAYGTYGRAEGYATQAGKLLGWGDVWPSGSGGTGYLNPGSGGRKTLRSRVTTDAINQSPDIVIVAAGINDSASTYAAVLAEAALLYDAIIAGLPYATLVVVGPFWSNESPTAGVLAVRDAVQTAAEARGLFFIDPIAQQWITAANKATYIGTDNTHPTVLGHKYFGRMLAANLQLIGH